MTKTYYRGVEEMQRARKHLTRNLRAIIDFTEYNRRSTRFSFYDLLGLFAVVLFFALVGVHAVLND